MNTEHTAEQTNIPAFSPKVAAELDAELLMIDERKERDEERRKAIRELYITHKLDTAHYYIQEIKGKATIVKHRERLNTILAMMGIDANQAVENGILTISQTDFADGLKKLNPIGDKESKKAYDTRIGKMASEAVAPYVVNGLGSYQLRSK